MSNDLSLSFVTVRNVLPKEEEGEGTDEQIEKNMITCPFTLKILFGNSCKILRVPQRKRRGEGGG